MTRGIATGSSAADTRQGDTRKGDLPDGLRIGAIVLTLAVVLVGPSPFGDRGSYLIEAGDGGNLVTQFLFLIVGAVTGGLILYRGLATLRPLVTVSGLMTVVWLFATTATSVAPMTSGRRLVALFILILAAAAVLVLARDRRQFAAILGGTALAIVVVSYLGLALVPERAIHSALDLTEPEHAGSWRGLYDHKNGAGGMMALFVFIGLFWRRAGAPILGTVLALLSAIFLVFSFAKSATALMPLVLVLSWLCARSSAGWWRAILIFGPVAALLCATVGTVLSPTIEAGVAAILGNASFTGRIEIWQFAVDNIAKRPITGYGYGAFWDSVFYGGGGDGDSWVNAIKSAHNSYLSVALDLGLPGLALTLWWYLLTPFRDLQSRGLGRDRGRPIDPLTLLFLRIWLFVMLLAVFETALYVPTNGLSFFVAMATFGLRYLACAPVVAGDARVRTAI